MAAPPHRSPSRRSSSLTYRYWGDESRWISVGFDSSDEAMDVFYPTTE
ncbi:MAG: hypothetical protein Q7J82_01195 [Coriobacteriia bacterium]|nr:hypothetical protein [Coriobacteriia bacterium]